LNSPGQDDRPALPETVLIERDVVLRQVIQLVEEIVGIEPGRAEVLVAAAGESVAARSSDEAQLDRAASTHVGPADGSRDGDGFDGILPRRHHGEEPLARLVEVVVVVHAVERDGDEGIRKAVEVRLAVGRRRVDARQERHRVDGVPRRKRHSVDFVNVERGRDRRRPGVDHIAAAGDRDSFGQSPDLECTALSDDGTPGTSRTLPSTDCLEAAQGDRDRVVAGGERRNVEHAFGAGDRVVGRVGAEIPDDDGRARNGAAVRIDDDTR
jgi:hypothetical protein